VPAPKRTLPSVDYKAEDALSPEERLDQLVELLSTVAVRVWKAERLAAMGQAESVAGQVPESDGNIKGPLT
jgi:hypothetical protein